jgi:hypothetical protein
LVATADGVANIFASFADNPALVGTVGGLAGLVALAASFLLLCRRKKPPMPGEPEATAMHGFDELTFFGDSLYENPLNDDVIGQSDDGHCPQYPEDPYVDPGRESPVDFLSQEHPE